MRTADQSLRDLAIRVGMGEHDAFRHLYAALAPATLSAIRDELPDATQSMHVVRATFCEVWWMCAFDVRCGTRRWDMAVWIYEIASRRCCERCHALDLIAHDVAPHRRAFWAGLLADQDQRTQFELATMLDGRDTVELPRVVRQRTAACVSGSLVEIPG